MSAAIVRADGNYGAVIVSGSNLRIDPESVGSQWRELGGASTLVLQNEVPKMVSVAAARAARADGSLVILNAAPARPMSADLLDCVDLLIVNRIEAEMLTGKTVQQRAGAFTAMYDLRKPGRGAEGLVVQAAGGEEPFHRGSGATDVIMRNERLLRVNFTQWPRRRGTIAISAQRTAGVDVKLLLQIATANVAIGTASGRRSARPGGQGSAFCCRPWSVACY